MSQPVTDSQPIKTELPFAHSLGFLTNELFGNPEDVQYLSRGSVKLVLHTNYRNEKTDKDILQKIVNNGGLSLGIFFNC